MYSVKATGRELNRAHRKEVNVQLLCTVVVTKLQQSGVTPRKLQLIVRLFRNLYI